MLGSVGDSMSWCNLNLLVRVGSQEVNDRVKCNNQVNE